MLNKKYLILLVALFVSLLPSGASAQTQMETINTFSSYTMYGIGELQTQGTLATRSMGGAGVAQRSSSSINLLNPASYSMAIPKSVLIDYGLEASVYTANQYVSGSKLTDKYVTANFHDIAFQMPVAKGLGFGFSLTPYSSVGYYQSSSSIMANVGYIQNIYTGSGDITEVKFGVGWEIAKSLSLGFAAQYYWGDIDRYFTTVVTSITATGVAESASGVENISVSRLKGQAGLQWSPISNNKRRLTFGATYDIGGDLSPRSARVVTSLAGLESVYTQNDTTRISLIIPRLATFGFNYSTTQLVISADYNYQNWLDLNDDVEFTGSGMEVGYNNFSTIKVGMEYTPKRTDIRHYYNRISYRLGARYGGYQYTFGGEEIPQYAVTLGAGLPFNVIGISKINVGMEWGSMGNYNTIKVNSQSIGLIKQNYFKFSLAFTMFGEDYWFQRPQID